VVVTLVSLLILVLIMLWRNLIHRAISIVKETTRVFRDIPLLMVWPLKTILLLVGICAYGIVIMFFIATIDENSYEDVANAIDAHAAEDFTKFLPDKNLQVVVSWIVHIFGVVWTLQVVMAIAWTTTAGSVCQWFFSHEVGQPKPSFGLGCGALWCSYWRILRYHMGSMAFGGLITAICSILRWILQTLDYYTHDMQKSNRLLFFVMKCVQCYMYCLEKTIQFITYYGYIFVALEGHSFCYACKETFVLVASYPAQVTVNNTVSSLLSLIISLSIPVATSLLTFIACEQSNKKWPIYPALLVFLVSYVIASAVCSTFKCAVDSIFLCAFKDMTPGPPKYMSDNLRSAFGIDSAEEDLKKAGRKPLRTIDSTKQALLTTEADSRP